MAKNLMFVYVMVLFIFLVVTKVVGKLFFSPSSNFSYLPYTQHFIRFY